METVKIIRACSLTDSKELDRDTSVGTAVLERELVRRDSSEEGSSTSSGAVSP